MTAEKIPSVTNETHANWGGLWMRPVFLSIKSWVSSMWWLFFSLTEREREKLISQEDSKKIIFKLFRMYKSQTKGNIHISVFPIQSECCHTRLSHDSSSEPVGRKMLRKYHYLIYLCTPALWFQSSFSVPDCCCYYKSTLDHLKINIPHIWIMDFSVCLIQKGKKKKYFVATAPPHLTK